MAGLTAVWPHGPSLRGNCRMETIQRARVTVHYVEYAGLGRGSIRNGKLSDKPSGECTYPTLICMSAQKIIQI